MSRKPTKGYFVKGQFVALGSELDLELKRELKGSDEPSRTELKHESDALQKLGTELLDLRADLIARLDLSEKFRDAITDAKRITNFEGKTNLGYFDGHAAAIAGGWVYLGDQGGTVNPYWRLGTFGGTHGAGPWTPA